MTRQQKIGQGIVNALKANVGFATWAQITESVSKEVQVKNWMEVRNVLQRLIDGKIVARTNDIFNECYKVVAK